MGATRTGPADPARTFLDPQGRCPAYLLLVAFDITPKSGPPLCGELWLPLGPNARRSGRRIVVRESAGGPAIFDTDDCYDLGNAINGLDLWLVKYQQTVSLVPTVAARDAIPGGPVMTCDVCGVEVGGDVELGQSTAETLMCAGCVARHRQAVPASVEDDDLGENDPTPLESELGIPHDGGEG